jgi:hypothetical protein
VEVSVEKDEFICECGNFDHSGLLHSHALKVLLMLRCAYVTCSVKHET